MALTEDDLRQRRLKGCIENWPHCESGEYNPACCRFPKSCSPHGYIEAVRAGNLTEDDLEPPSTPRPAPTPAATPDPLRDRLQALCDAAMRNKWHLGAEAVSVTVAQVLAVVGEDG